MKKNLKIFLCEFLVISLLFISSFNTVAFAETNNTNSSETNVSYSETYLDANNQLHVKAELIESTAEYQKFVAKIPVSTNSEGIKASTLRDSVGIEEISIWFFESGLLEVEVQCKGWELIKYGTMNGIKTYGAIGSRTYSPSISASNLTPGPIITFLHNFTGLSTYISGTQYVQAGAGTLTLVNGYGSFTSFTTDFQITAYN